MARRYLLLGMGVLILFVVSLAMLARGPALGAASLPQVTATLTAAPKVPSPVRRSPARVTVNLETREDKGVRAAGVEYVFWNFNGTVPGPMIRVRIGDEIVLRLRNAQTSKQIHSIDLHAVNGPGGGAGLTQVPPGKEAAFRFKALNPGLSVYHRASPHIPTHIANGMYGLILVEPEGGLPRVDREYYVMQGEFYTKGALGEKGLQAYDSGKGKIAQPEYVVFNGRVGSLVDGKALTAQVGGWGQPKRAAPARPRRRRVDRGDVIAGTGDLPPGRPQHLPHRPRCRGHAEGDGEREQRRVRAGALDYAASRADWVRIASGWLGGGRSGDAWISATPSG